MKTITIKDSTVLFEADTIGLGNSNHKVVGELYQDYYISEDKELVATEKYVIREYKLNTKNSTIDFNDYRIDPTTIVEVFGCDFSDNDDITYVNGEYVC